MNTQNPDAAEVAMTLGVLPSTQPSNGYSLISKSKSHEPKGQVCTGGVLVPYTVGSFSIETSRAIKLAKVET